MAILLRGVTLGLDEPESRLLALAAHRLKVREADIRAFAIAQRSIDARKKEVHLSYNIELALNDISAEKRQVHRLRRADVVYLEAKEDPRPTSGREPLPARPIVVGFGPGGMFAALRLAQFGYRPWVLERGRDVRRRHRDVMHRFYRLHEFDPVSNLLFGEGGAGTYSDGKLYSRIHDPLSRHVLEVFYHHGADPDILINSRPHIGSDRLPTICTRIRETIESLGGEVCFECQLDDIRTSEPRALARDPTSNTAGPSSSEILTGIHVQSNAANSRSEWSSVGPVILAVGHSARDTIRMLAGRGVRIDPKPYQLGVRIEHPQAMVDRWQYGTCAGHSRLEPAEYHLVAKGAAAERGDVFSFCMCPGGVILPTNESPGLIATNGASRANRSGEFANSGLVITIDPSSMNQSALDALAYQETWERLAFVTTGGTYEVPAQRASDYLSVRKSNGALRTSYPLGGRWADIRSLIPELVASALGRALVALGERMPGFAGDEAIITAPETRASAPFRITRDPDTRESMTVANLYPVGEGAGYAGGIVSAAVDGIKTADAIISRYAPHL